MILFSDKNAGLIVVNRDDYPKIIMDQHLSTKETYEIIAREEASEHLLELPNAFMEKIS